MKVKQLQRPVYPEVLALPLQVMVWCKLQLFATSTCQLITIPPQSSEPRLSESTKLIHTY